MRVSVGRLKNNLAKEEYQILYTEGKTLRALRLEASRNIQQY